MPRLYPISERLQDTQLLSESKLERVRFSVAFSLTLRKPRGEQTTVRLSFARQCQRKKELLCQHWQCTNESQPTAKFFLLYDRL